MRTRNSTPALPRRLRVLQSFPPAHPTHVQDTAFLRHSVDSNSPPQRSLWLPAVFTAKRNPSIFSREPNTMTTSVHTSAPEKRGPHNLDRKHSGTWKSLPTPFPSGRLPATEIRLEASFLTLTPHSPHLCALPSPTAQLYLPAGLTHHSGGWPRHCPGLRPWAHRKKPLVSALPSSSSAFLNVKSTHGRPQLHHRPSLQGLSERDQSCPHTQLSGPIRTRTPDPPEERHPLLCCLL